MLIAASRAFDRSADAFLIARALVASYYYDLAADKVGAYLRARGQSRDDTTAYDTMSAYATSASSSGGIPWLALALVVATTATLLDRHPTRAAACALLYDVRDSFRVVADAFFAGAPPWFVSLNPHELAMDLLSLLIYRVDVRIILDNSGSMGLDLFGQGVNTSSSSPRGSAWIDERTMENPSLMRDVYRRMATGWGGGGRNAGLPMPVSGCSPHHRRWHFARDALTRWRAIFDVLGIDPFVYLLNGMSGVNGTKVYSSELDRVFANRPGGGTPLSEALLRALGEHNAEAGGRTLLLLVLTDGEANDMVSFNRTLDECQNGVYGDVQVCFMGLSLVAKDIEWFENEECDDTRIRTVEPYEVEQRQMQLKEVVAKEGGYTYAMHTLRVLVTNLFPADYDYEAPLQNLRHRLYITLHGRDRWWGLNNCCWRLCCSGACCCCWFVCSGGHCCGWCQGNECCSCKCQYPLWCESDER